MKLNNGLTIKVNAPNEIIALKIGMSQLNGNCIILK